MKESINKKLYNNTTVELKEEKVELAVIDDIKAYNNGYSKLFSELQGLQKRGDRLKTELNETVQAIYKMGNLSEDMANDMVKLLNNFEQKAKELGINPKENKDFIEGEKKFKAYMETYNAAYRLAENYKK